MWTLCYWTTLKMNWIIVVYWFQALRFVFQLLKERTKDVTGNSLKFMSTIWHFQKGAFVQVSHWDRWCFLVLKLNIYLRSVLFDRYVTRTYSERVQKCRRENSTFWQCTKVVCAFFAYWMNVYVIGTGLGYSKSSVPHVSI